jgi:hypothetical protein
MASLLAKEGVEVHLRAPQIKAEHFWRVNGRIVILTNSTIARKQHLDDRMHLVTGSKPTIRND